MLRTLGTPPPHRPSQAPTARPAAIACPWLSPVQSLKTEPRPNPSESKEPRLDNHLAGVAGTSWK